MSRCGDSSSRPRSSRRSCYGFPHLILRSPFEHVNPAHASALRRAGPKNLLQPGQLGIPTVVYGPGSLAYAHGTDEQISASEIATAAEVLAHTISRFPGASGSAGGG